MTDSNKIFGRIFFSSLLIPLAIVVVCVLCSGCEILKSKSSKSTDSTSVNKLDVKDTAVNTGGTIKTNESKLKEENEWWKTTVQYGQRRDTSVTNVYPTAIVYERGRGIKEESSKSSDSSWYFNMQMMMTAYFDSTNKKLTEISKSKESETKGLGLMTILLIGLGIVVLNKGLGFISSKYSVVKKSIN